MKTTLFALLTLLPTFSFAATPVVQMAVNTMGNVVVATLDNDGNLALDDAQSHARIVATRVQARTFNLIAGLTQQLAVAPVVRTHSTFVCHAIVPGNGVSIAISNFNAKANAFTGQLHEVLSAEGCQNPDHTVPSTAEDLATARQLRAALETLVFEHSNN